MTKSKAVNKMKNTYLSEKGDNHNCKNIIYYSDVKWYNKECDLTTKLP